LGLPGNAAMCSALVLVAGSRKSERGGPLETWGGKKESEKREDREEERKKRGREKYVLRFALHLVPFLDTLDSSMLVASHRKSERGGLGVCRTQPQEEHALNNTK
jgi:hypothetical protein